MASVVPLYSWPRETKWRTHLLENGWKQDEKPFVILDEAQMLYGDVGLWGEFFKELRSFKDQFTIAFASYGSPTSPFTIEGTPMFVGDLQRVTLQAIDHNDGFGAVGLLFSPEEFNDLVHKQFSPPRYYFHQSFFDAIFHLTGGHAGAINDFV